MNISEIEYAMGMQALQLADEVEAAFHVGPSGPGIAAVLLFHAKRESTAAMLALADVDATDIKAVQNMQNEIQRFRDLARWIRAVVDQGQELARNIKDDDIRGLANLVNPEYQEDDD